ncbi:MAG: metallophosphoesterase [Gammaproteobacteria bacterium]
MTKPLRVVQVSDSHLSRDVASCAHRVKVDQSLSSVIALIREEQLATDLFLVTGDLSQDGSVESYRRFFEQLMVFKRPIYGLPGNHDVVDVMRSVAPNPLHISPCSLDQKGWRIILLNSWSGQRYGELSDDQLCFLDHALQGSVAAGSYHCMVCLHHHPVPLNSAWLDREGLKNAYRFFEVLDRYDHVRAVVWGHVHQGFHGWRREVALFAAPSTCYQFKPECRECKVDDLAPGYRWFDLYRNGRIESAVSRVRTGVLG